MFNFYDLMKERTKKMFTTNAHWLNLFNVLESMFIWKGLPDTIRPEQLEGLLISRGIVGVGEIDGDLWCGDGSYTGEIRGFIPKDYQFQVMGVGQKIGEVGKDIVVGWNNATRTPDLILMQYASILSEIDISERLNVIFARHLRIPKVHSKQEKTVVESAIKAIQTGKVEAVVSDFGHDVRALTGTQEDSFLDLSDVREIDKIQYLSKYRDDIIRRFFQIYGISMQVSTKMAQQSNDEIHSGDGISMTLFMQRYRYRKQLAEDINKLFGLSVSVEMADAWKDSFKDITEGGKPDEADTLQDQGYSGKVSDDGSSEAEA